jgi:hypothetical protein
MSWHAIDALSDARTATGFLLLPFDAATWAKLALVALFVGTGTNASLTANGSGSVSTGASGVPLGPDVVSNLPAIDALSALSPGSLVGLALSLLAAFVALYLVYALLGSVFEFVFVVAVSGVSPAGRPATVGGPTDRRVRLRGPFRANVGNGVRLFAFKLALGLAVLALVALPVAAWLLSGAPVGPAILLVTVPIAVLVAAAGFVAALVAGLTREFVVPTMLVEDCGVLAGWRRVLPTMRAEWEEFALYVVVRIALGVLAGALLAVAVGLVAVVVALPFVLLGGVAAAAFSPLGPGGLSTVALATFVGLALAYLAVLAAASLFVSVPVVAYFRYYPLFLLARVDADLDLVSRYGGSGGGDRPADDRRSTESDGSTA